MIVVLILVLVALLGYAGACTLSGLQPSAVRLTSFVPDPAFGTLSRRFTGSVSDVHRAFTNAVLNAPGMSVIDQDQHRLLIDSKPSVLVMDGNYGVIICLEFFTSAGHEGDEEGGRWTEVTVRAAPKVGWAIATRQRASLIEIERNLRMTAKQRGLLSEIVG